MPIEHESLQFAHDEGHTDVCYSSSGRKFITCGADGDISIWSLEDGEDPVHNCIGELALCIKQKDDNIYVSTGSNDIQILKFPEAERNGVLSRFVAPINHIAISKNTQHVALAGEDMEVKLINLEKQEKEVIVFDGPKGPCLSVALCPDFKSVAASSGDGKLRIWNIHTKELLKEIDCFPKVNSFTNAKVLCRIDFSKKFLAYPEKDTVVLIDTENWSEKAKLSSPLVTSAYSIVEFSPCGKYLAACSAGYFVIFNIVKKCVYEVSEHPNGATISGFNWNPCETGKIVYTDVEGHFGVMSNCRPRSQNGESDDFEDEPVLNIDDDDDEDDENVISVEKIKRQVMGEAHSESELEFDTRSLVARSSRPRTPEVEGQMPFMPSSTPEHLNPRYLCWNDVGVIRSYGSSIEDDTSKSIEIEFHDSTFHNSMMMQNFQDYTMGSISKSALVLANTSQICVIPLNATSKEWTLKTEDPSQEIVSVATSLNIVCFATSNYFVRVCSIFGVQTIVVSIPGPLVSMASFENNLLVAYHNGAVRKNDQNIAMKLFRFTGFSMVSEDIQSALAPETTLMWLGYTDLGTPAMMDSSGMLSLYPMMCKAWIPFCDTAKHNKSPADGFFVTAIAESSQSVIGIKCKGTMYPSFIPRPTICEILLNPPFCDFETEKSQLEANLFTWSNLNVSDTDKRFMETGLKSFALACRNNLDERALELMDMLAKPQLLTLGTKYAVKSNKKKLAEKLMEMASTLMDEVPNVTFEKELSTPDSSSLSGHRKLPTTSIKRIRNTKLENKEATTPEVVQIVPLTSVLNNTLNESTVSNQSSPVTSDYKNPFLRKKESEVDSNPLSLTNKFAGVEYNSKPKTKANENVEKRKQPDSATDPPKEKQRKLDKFLFTKRS